MDDAESPGGIGGSRAPERITALPYTPEDNARKRFELERERRRAEKNRKDPKEPSTSPDVWDGDSQAAADPPAPEAVPGTRSDRDGRRGEGGLDVVV